ncbi:fumarylacetoacetate hydrolase [Bernardetia litoralis DSM 6794]|uniref:fumarylacetoacetase n=1 Tax=Bernardetia litoralis (strain ATCC 23117 / DSM 6794 / NBRC 15988 / NCIMB 1366 / Fx l1 / Sio-4) TaxID=880071 RepID=I4ALZ4_BERLS|nr:fumarylacetoacetase [Bernardetia litoralis]AFM04979.1 fumarylacetoacetate hydrolase [Bernardetia litoralis DSM 6794]
MSVHTFKANNPALKSFVEVSKDSDFPIQNLPFGIFSTDNAQDARVGIRIGDFVLDMSQLSELNFLGDLNFDHSVFYENILNPFIELGQTNWRATREKVSELLQVGSDLEQQKDSVLFPVANVTMHLPVKVGDYTDFYSSIEHATNLGKLFRPNAEALMPNWKHIPVGYHGRASSIVISGTEIHRPKGQIKPNPDEAPIFSPCKTLDFELEMAFIVGKATKLGDSVTVDTAEDHIFGMTVFNDWSARDIQKWEYVPLGPFLGKSFASSMSPWVVTLDALEPFRVASPKQDSEVLDYLKYTKKHNFNISLEVDFIPENGEATTISHSSFKYLYWNMAQQLTHHTVNGCNINVGDVCASGTISGKDENSYGSLIELTQGGKKMIPLKNGVERKFIQDNDTIVMRGFCQNDSVRIGFGEVSGKILPAK